MSNRSDLNLAEIYPYLFDHSVRESQLLRELREETARDPMARMQIAPEQGQFMALLIRLMGARQVIEVGTFTGYSSLCIAEALPDGGHLLCCDVNEKWTSMARRYWQRAGVDDRITLMIASAQQTLQNLISEGKGGGYDAVFIDADKENYATYYEMSLELLRPGGLIMIDNVLWGGRVLDQETDDVDTLAIQALNRDLHKDSRVDLSMLPIADGLTLARKRG